MRLPQPPEWIWKGEYCLPKFKKKYMATNLIVIAEEDLRQILRQELQGALNQNPSPNITPHKKHYKLPDAAALIGVADSSMYRLVKEGKIPTHGSGKFHYFLHDDLLKYIEGRRPSTRETIRQDLSSRLRRGQKGGKR
jgi:hypothetical protein